MGKSKLSNSQTHLYLVKSQNAIAVVSDTELKQLAKAFCAHLKINPYEDYLKYWLKISAASNNLEAIIFWLSKQQLISDQLPNFKDLANKFQDEVDELTPSMYF